MTEAGRGAARSLIRSHSPLSVARPTKSCAIERIISSKAWTRADVKGRSDWVQLELPRPLPAATRRALLRSLRLRHAEGGFRVVAALATNHLATAAVRGIVINGRDVSGQKRAEDALRESEEQFRAVFDGALDSRHARLLLPPAERRAVVREQERVRRLQARGVRGGIGQSR